MGLLSSLFYVVLTGSACGVSLRRDGGARRGPGTCGTPAVWLSRSQTLFKEENLLWINTYYATILCI